VGIVVSFCAFCQASFLSFLFAGSFNTNSQNVIWEYRLPDFSDDGYGKAVHHLFDVYERTSKRKLIPGEQGRVGLKVYSASGLGLSTPKALVLAVIQELEARKFSRKDIFIIDEAAYNLRRSGFLPELSQGGDTFKGVKVYALDQNRYWDDDWFYTSSIPSRSAISEFFVRGVFNREASERSYLPVPLILDADFWINLPMVTSHETIGVCGAMANATIFNISNNKRFIENRVHASVAIAEIAAIPEFQETWVFTLMTLERYQFIGGFMFNFRYTQTEPFLWLSTNANAMDYLMFQRINKARAQERLRIFKNPPDFFEYAKSLDIGDYEDVRVVSL